MRHPALRPGVLPAAVLATCIAVQSVVAVLAGATPVRDSGFRLVSPGDGAEVGRNFTLEWSRGAYAGRFAVILGDSIPAPGAVLKPSADVVVTTLTVVRLGLSPRQGGSPSAQDWHALAIIPLDASGRRRGEDVLLVRVRTRA